MQKVGGLVLVGGGGGLYKVVINSLPLLKRLSFCQVVFVCYFDYLLAT